MNVSDTSWAGVTFHFLRGLPRAGKSTKAASLVKEYGGVVVEGDAVRLALFNAQYNPRRDDELWNTIYTLTKALVYAGHHYIILDGTWCMGTQIDGFIDAVVPLQFLDSIEIRTEYIDTPADVCIRRALDRHQGAGICRGIAYMVDHNDWHRPYIYNYPDTRVQQLLKG